jgi:3-deoxy-D-manno-octulosonate 8-phosphate phosphatase (KDO 8-P phosphatase)
MVTGRPRLVRDTRFGGLPLDELQERARRTRVVLSDCDGVLTDGTVYVSEAGEAMKRFSLRDGMGTERLRQAGIETAIVTRERSPVVARRAEKLRLPLFEGVLDKGAELPRILDALGCAKDEVAYIGDDVNDLGIMSELGRAGLTGAPFDAFAPVFGSVHYLCRACGGEGAYREFAEWILRLRGAGQGSHERGGMA